MPRRSQSAPPVPEPVSPALAQQLADRHRRMAQWASNAQDALGAAAAALLELPLDDAPLRLHVAHGARFAVDETPYLRSDLHTELTRSSIVLAEDLSITFDPLPEAITEPMRRLGCRSVAAAQLHYAPEARLILLIGWPSPLDRAPEALEPLASLIGAAYAAEELQAKNEQLAIELERHQDQLRCLLEIGSGLLGELDLRELFVKLSRQQMGRNLSHDLSAVALLEPDGLSLRLYACDLVEAHAVYDPELLIPAADSPEGWVCRHRKHLRIESLADDRHRFPSAFYQHLIAEDIARVIWAPLMTRNRVLGAFCVGVRRDNQQKKPEQTLDFVQQIANQLAVVIENSSAYQQIAQLRDRLAQEKLYLEDELRGELNFDEIVGSSPAMQRVREQLAVVAPTDSTVLLLGESGVGKELLARAIHASSLRRDATFIKVNCPAIPAGLLESELFGHERGAFTGAIARKIGRAELANGGALFLDEIGDLPLELQPKLLRLLQEHEFERLGSAQTRRADARIIAATNRDLASMVATGQFRQDLFYRLNVFPILVPPLRERREEIPELARFFTQKHSRKLRRPIEEIAPEAMQALLDWTWPGNVRELENLIERAVLLNGSSRSLRLPPGELASARTTYAIPSPAPAAPQQTSPAVQSWRFSNSGEQASASQQPSAPQHPAEPQHASVPHLARFSQGGMHPPAQLHQAPAPSYASAASVHGDSSLPTANPSCHPERSEPQASVVEGPCASRWPTSARSANVGNIHLPPAPQHPVVPHLARFSQGGIHPPAQFHQAPALSASAANMHGDSSLPTANPNCHPERSEPQASVVERPCASTLPTSTLNANVGNIPIPSAPQQPVVPHLARLSQGGIHPPAQFHQAPAPHPTNAPSAPDWRQREREQIIAALNHCRGRIGGPDGAAALLGLKRTTLASRMKKLGLD